MLPVFPTVASSFCVCFVKELCLGLFLTPLNPATNYFFFDFLCQPSMFFFHMRFRTWVKFQRSIKSVLEGTWSSEERSNNSVLEGTRRSEARSIKSVLEGTWRSEECCSKSVLEAVWTDVITHPPNPTPPHRQADMNWLIYRGEIPSIDRHTGRYSLKTTQM